MIRWMIRKDVPQVMRIIQAEQQNGFSEEKLIEHLRNRNVIGVVYEKQRRVRGFCIYQLHKHSIEVLHLIIGLEDRRGGIGSKFMDALANKLNLQRRREIMTNVDEHNLGAQLFLRANHFRCVAITGGNATLGWPEHYHFIRQILTLETLATTTN